MRCRIRGEWVGEWGLEVNGLWEGLEVDGLCEVSEVAGLVWGMGFWHDRFGDRCFK